MRGGWQILRAGTAAADRGKSRERSRLYGLGSALAISLRVAWYPFRVPKSIGARPKLLSAALKVFTGGCRQTTRGRLQRARCTSERRMQRKGSCERQSNSIDVVYTARGTGVGHVKLPVLTLRPVLLATLRVDVRDANWAGKVA
eukprot:546380-Rhodomonas_salina.5